MEKNTEYQISSSVNDGILEIVLSGEVTRSNVEILKNEMTAIITASGIKKVLVDVRAIKGNFGYADAYNRVRNYPRDLLVIQVAFLDNPDKNEFKSFYETTAYNVGLHLKWFTDIDAAKNWLKGMQIYSI